MNILKIKGADGKWYGVPSILTKVTDADLESIQNGVIETVTPLIPTKTSDLANDNEFSTVTFVNNACQELRVDISAQIVDIQAELSGLDALLKTI